LFLIQNAALSINAAYFNITAESVLRLSKTTKADQVPVKFPRAEVRPG
jgi:hypothetical protein